jgi:hypothetical protein
MPEFLLAGEATAVLNDVDRPMTAADLAGELRDHVWRFEVNPNDGRS